MLAAYEAYEVDGGATLLVPVGELPEDAVSRVVEAAEYWDLLVAERRGALLLRS